MWVYGPAVLKMSNQLPSLLPTALELTDHYAHPMFYFFSAGLWGNLFGASIVSVHAFSLTVSVLFLVVLYLVIRHFAGNLIAFLTVLVCCVQSIFLGQAALALPEVMLSLLMLTTIYFYHKRMRWAYVVSGVLMVLTKETGVLLIASLGIWSLVRDVIYDKKSLFTRNTFVEYLVLVLPLVALTIHMLLLKLNYGWYIMPDRMEHFEFTIDAYYRRIRNSFHYVFIDQGRQPLIILLAVAVSIFNVNLKWWQRISVGVLMFAMLKVFFNYWKMPSLFPLIVVPILTMILLKKLIWDEYKQNGKNELLAIFSIFIVLYLLFSSAQFDSLRYLLCTIPMYVFLTLYFAKKAMPKFHVIGLIIVSVLCLSSSVYFMMNDESFGDDTLKYVDVCMVMKETVQFLEENEHYQTAIQVPFLYEHALKRPFCGYLSSNKKFDYLYAYSDTGIRSIALLRIFDNMEGKDTYTSLIKEDAQELIYENQKGAYWVKIYKTK